MAAFCLFFPPTPTLAFLRNMKGREGKGKGNRKMILRWQRFLFPIFPLLLFPVFLLILSRALLITRSWLSPRSGWQNFLAAVLLLLKIFLLRCFLFEDSPLLLHDRNRFVCWYQLDFSQHSSFLRLQRSWGVMTFHLSCFPSVAHSLIPCVLKVL